MKLNAKARLVSSAGPHRFFTVGELRAKGKEIRQALEAEAGRPLTRDELMAAYQRKLEAREPLDLHLKTGAFHKWLGKSEDEPITMADIKKGLASDDPHVQKMAQFAKNARKWKH